MIKDNTQKIIAGGIWMFFLISSVSALAISSAYWDGLRISPGETKEIYLTLQNIIGQGDIYVKGEILNGSDMAKLTDSSDVYFVPLGEKTKVNISVTAPKNAKLGDNYILEFAFTTMITTEGGTFGFGSSVGQKVNVIVGTSAEIKAEQEKKTKITYYIAIGIVILLVVIFYVMKKKKIIRF